jgi:hypothetical protein
MAGKFLGKWTLFGLREVPGSFLITLGFLGYDPNKSNQLSMLFGDMNNPSRAAHIAFILRDDGHVCFQLNNGRYICYMRDDDDDEEDADPFLFTMLDTLQYAMGFTLPGQNAQSLPTSFASLIQLQDQFVTYYVVIINDSDGSVVSYDDASHAITNRHSDKHWRRP